MVGLSSFNDKKSRGFGVLGVLYTCDFVFAPIGTNWYKDEVMQKPDEGSGGRFPQVPAIIFPNWREMLNRAPLSPPARGGYALAISSYLEHCLGHVDVATTQIYTHVMKKPGIGVRSPLDS